MINTQRLQRGQKHLFSLWDSKPNPNGDSKSNPPREPLWKVFVNVRSWKINLKPQTLNFGSKNHFKRVLSSRKLLSRKFNRQLTMFSQNFTKKTITLSSS
jgi:hypothetical protein